MSYLDGICRHISSVTGKHFKPESERQMQGGCINSAILVRSDDRQYFVKTNTQSGLPMFEAEAEGLKQLAAGKHFRIPAVICTGISENTAYLVLEYIQTAPPASSSFIQAGKNLAEMHRQSSESFGWTRDNTIGATPQVNRPSSDWPDFWKKHRLGYQLQLAAKNGYGGRLQASGEKLMAYCDSLLDHQPDISLLHGDLWSGNMAFTTDGEPVIFDPAVYFGDREADLAMTELFGGFDQTFYQAYNDCWPLKKNYKIRKHLYNTYHILNHLNLFGGSYLHQAIQMMERLLSETR